MPPALPCIAQRQMDSRRGPWLPEIPPRSQSSPIRRIAPDVKLHSSDTGPYDPHRPTMGGVKRRGCKDPAPERRRVDANLRRKALGLEAVLMKLADEVLDVGSGPAASPRISGCCFHSLRLLRPALTGTA